MPPCRKTLRNLCNCHVRDSAAFQGPVYFVSGCHHNLAWQMVLHPLHR